MKRFTAFLLVIALMCSVLAACGGKEETIPPVTAARTVHPVGSSYTVYVKAYPGWGTVRLWAWSGSGEGDLFDAYPGEAMELGTDGWYYMKIPTKYDWVAINGLEGNIQTEDESTGGRDIWFTIVEDGYYVDTSKPSDTAATAAPADGYIAELTGNWENVHLNDGRSSLNVSAKVFNQTVYNCTEMTISMEVEMNAGTSCKDWQVWGRSGGSFVKLGKIYLAAGNGYTSQTLTFATPVTFDAIAITPTIPGGYSWSMGFIVTDVWTK